MIILAAIFFVHIVTSIPPPNDCQDNTWQCITWKKYCNDPMNKIYMESNFRETCGLCPKCEDKSSRCVAWKNYCFDPANINYMSKNCALTCGFCTVPTTTPKPSPTPSWKVIPAGQCGISQVKSGRVINGVDAKRGAWPWQVLIRYHDQPHCGGSIISPFWIVTAAHCVYGKESLLNEFKIIVGEHDFNVKEGSEVSIGVSKIITHQKYSSMYLDYDVALIKLNRPVPFDKKHSATVCLPKSGDAVPVGTKCYITGWGKIKAHDIMHHKLQQAVLPVVENSKCKNLNTNTTNIPVTSRMVCAGHGPISPTGGCHGDSGGPFVCQTGPNGEWVLHGAVSWGSSSCDSKEAFTVFARMSYLRTWIDKTMAAK